MVTCPSTAEIDSFVTEGRVDPNLSAHVETCGACRRMVERVEEDNRLAAELLDACASDVATSTGELEAIEIEGYRILEKIHRGGQGVVYRAIQLATKRTVAIKLLLDGAFATPARRRRFEREIELVAQLDHPGIVTVFDSGVTERGQNWFVMEYIDGVHFDHVGRERRSTRGGRSLRKRSQAELLELFVRTADAVHFAHRRGVIHRDLKPANILVDAAGQPHVLDFGLAKGIGAALEEGEKAVVTRTGAFLGTLAYASPEQVSGHPSRIDVRTDVYSLGILLYELLTGRLPYALAGQVREWIQSICERPPDPVGSGIDSELETILLKALAKDPERRYQSAGDLGRDVRHYLAGEAIDARRDSTWYLLVKTLRRNRLLTSLGVAMAVVLAISSVVSSFFWNEAVEAAGLADERSETLLRLSDGHRLGVLIARAEELWPAHPARIGEYRTWLAAAERLGAKRPEHVATLERIRASAKPWSDVERARDRATHPELEDLERKSRERERAAATLVDPGDLDRLNEEELERLAELEEELPALEAEIADLEERVSARRTWTLRGTEDQWWHDELQVLLERLDAFLEPESGLVADVRRRLDFALEVADASVSGALADERWREAIASIADPDECPAYGGLVIERQMGLLPIGRDAGSGLWEFAHLQTGEAPERRGDGRLGFGEESGIVLVLIPGGTFWMGGQPMDEEAPNYDPRAMPLETPVHEVTLEPYFLSKYEMSMAQWERFARENPSLYPPPKASGPVEHTLLHPVEHVSWIEADRVLRQLGLVLPTEAQWEYGTRARTTTPWWTGAERSTLEGAINIADQSAGDAGAQWEQIKYWPELRDGFPSHAPVDRFLPNPFGLHNVHGNVNEWCREWSESYLQPVREGDGEREPDIAMFRIFRGGSFLNSANRCRSSDRNRVPAEYVSAAVGVRPARALVRN